MIIMTELPNKAADADVGSVQHDEESDLNTSNVEIRAAVRKVDKRLIPLLALLYLLAFLDRGNGISACLLTPSHRFLADFSACSR